MSYGLPQPPLEMAAASIQLQATVILGVLAITALLHGLRVLLTKRDPIFLLVVIGGGACILIEPIVDIMGGCWHPVHGQWTLFSAMGRPMPYWLFAAYFVYFGGQTALIMRYIDRGLAPKLVWSMWAFAIVSDIILEEVLMRFQVYAYYGNQPLILNKFPIWWAPVNSLAVLLGALLIHRFRLWLTGIRSLLIVPAVVSISAAVNGATAWPTWFAINSDLGVVGTQLAGLATVALSASGVWAFSKNVERPSSPTETSAMPSIKFEVTS